MRVRMQIIEGNLVGELYFIDIPWIVWIQMSYQQFSLIFGEKHSKHIFDSNQDFTRIH